MLPICLTLTVAIVSSQAPADAGAIAELSDPPWVVESRSVRHDKTNPAGARYEMRYASGALFAEGTFVWKGAPFARPTGTGRLLYPHGRLLTEITVTRKSRHAWADAGTWYFVDGQVFATIEVDEAGAQRVTLGPHVQGLIHGNGPASVMKRCPDGTRVRAHGPTWSGLSSKGKHFGELVSPFELVCAGASGPAFGDRQVTFHLNGTVRSVHGADGQPTRFWYSDGTLAATRRGDTTRCWRADRRPVKNCVLGDFLADHVDWLVVSGSPPK